MSITYYGVTIDDPRLIGEIVEGAHDAPPVDEATIRAALEGLVEGPPDGTLKWEDESGYVFVDVLESHVEITQGGASDEVIDILLEIVEVLRHQGLRLWDPQRGNWLTE